MGDTPTAARGMRWLLWASLAFNLLIVGIVVGAFLDGPRRDGGVRGVRDVVAPYTRALAPSDRRALLRELRRGVDRQGDRGSRATALAAPYRQVVEILRQAPFDAGALEEALRAQTEAMQARSAMGRAVLARHIAGMTQAERQAYADRLEDEIARLAKARRPGWR